MSSYDIHIWGDSIARGVIYDEARGRYALSPERLSKRLKDANIARITDRSAMGATSEDGLRGFMLESPDEGAICAIEYGGNDCDLDWATVSQSPEGALIAKVPPERYAQALERFIAVARERGMTPVLCTPPPLCAARYFAWVSRGLNADNIRRALGDVEHIYRWQEHYTIAMRQVAQRTQCRLVDVRDAFLADPRGEGLLCIDGIHPSNEGHKLIADTALEALVKQTQ